MARMLLCTSGSQRLQFESLGPEKNDTKYLPFAFKHEFQEIDGICLDLGLLVLPTLQRP